MNWVEIIIGIVSGGALVTLATLPFIVKKSKAEARALEIDNLQKAMESWKQLADERQEENTKNDERIDQLNTTIDGLYKDIGDWRDKYNGAQDEITALKVWRAANEVKLCQIKGCENRTPPTGY